jgi:hypothetical protein
MVESTADKVYIVQYMYYNLPKEAISQSCEVILFDIQQIFKDSESLLSYCKTWRAWSRMASQESFCSLQKGSHYSFEIYLMASASELALTNKISTKNYSL